MFGLLREWFGGRQTGDTGLPPGLLTQEAFEACLFNERARADRAGSTFSLVAFRVLAVESQHRKLAERVLAHVLLKRTRNIDLKGRYGEGLGLILPYTPSPKVEMVWNNIHDGYRRRMSAEALGRVEIPRVTCEVYAYPGNERVHLSSESGA